MPKVRIYIIFVFIIYALLAALIYGGTLNNPFVLDDMAKIQFNPDLRASTLDLGQFVKPYSSQETSYRNDPSRPLTFICYWSVWHIFGGGPWGFHLLNLIVHLGCAFLLFGLISDLLAGNPRARQAALVGSSLFLVSPLLAGSVLYAFALSDLLATFFILWALRLHLRLKSNSVAEVVLFALALASKQSAIVLPALFFLVDRASAPKPWRRYVPVILTGVFYIFLRGLFLGGVGDLEAHGEVYASGPYFAAQGLMILKYLSMIIKPGDFSIDHYLTPNLYPEGWLTFGWAGVVLMSAAFATIKRLRPLAWSWFFFLVCLIPTSSFLPTVDLFVERRAYLPAVGIYAAFGILFVRARERFPLKVVSLLILLSFIFKFSTNAVLTYRRGQTFASAERIWQESLALYPQSPRARLNLATAYSAHGNYEPAAALLRDLLAQQPQNGIIYSKLGFIYSQNQNPERNLERAWSYYQKSFETEPNDVIALLNAASLLINLNQLDLATTLVKRVFELSPRMAYAHYVAAQIARAQKRPVEARQEVKAALALDPGFNEARALAAQLGNEP